MYSNIAIAALVLLAVASSAAVPPKATARAPRAEYNVRDFGAVGDGKKDDSTAFQTAIDEAFLDGGGVVVVPGAVNGYVLAKPLLIRPNVTMKGSM